MKSVPRWKLEGIICIRSSGSIPIDETVKELKKKKKKVRTLFSVSSGNC